MKKIALTTLLMAVFSTCLFAQTSDNDENYIVVNYKGEKPTISDFVTAILSREEIGEALNDMAEQWEKHLKGKALPKECTITVDSKNGYVRYEINYPDNEKHYIEYCYWNCSDGKHKLVGENIMLIMNGKPVETELTGLTFYMYDNKSHKLNYAYASELGDEVDMPNSTIGVVRNLPRQGKTIEYIFYTPLKKLTKHLTWNGSKFVKDK